MDSVYRARAALRSEIERLTERGMEAEAWCNQLNVEIERLRAENESLRRALEVVPGKPTEQDIEWARAALEPKPSCRYPDCDGGPATGYCHVDCRAALEPKP